MYQGNGYDLAAVMPEALETGLFVSLCTFRAPTGKLTGAGSPDLTSGPNGDGYVDVSGYVNIQCMSAPTSNIRISADERKTATETESSNSGHVLLAGYYPLVAQNTQWQAVIDGVTFDVLGAESDSQMQMTRVKVQIASV